MIALYETILPASEAARALGCFWCCRMQTASAFLLLAELSGTDTPERKHTWEHNCPHTTVVKCTSSSAFLLYALLSSDYKSNPSDMVVIWGWLLYPSYHMYPGHHRDPWWYWLGQLTQLTLHVNSTSVSANCLPSLIQVSLWDPLQYWKLLW